MYWFNFFPLPMDEIPYFARVDRLNPHAPHIVAG